MEPARLSIVLKYSLKGDVEDESLKKHGIFTYLSTDHGHYWEDGGATYHGRYSAFSLNRGQEGDRWQVNRELVDAVHNNALLGQTNYFDKANREFLNCEERMPQAVTFQAGLDFLEKNHDEDNWFLQIETFDPHEPFFTQPEYKKAFAHEYDGPLKDWPPYYPVTEGEDSVRHMRMEYAALITMCDRYLGKVLDKMDEYNLWEDTMLIVNTDHGFLLGEHGWWAKTVMPYYEEISRTPLFVYDPRSKVCAQRRSQLTQTIDLAPTILEFFGQEIPESMEGKSLRSVIERGEKIHDYVIFGDHAAHCNITDGNWVYMKAPVDGAPNYEYTLMPTHMGARFGVDELQNVQLQEPFAFTKGCRTMKIRAKESLNSPVNFGSKLFCLAEDPKQEHSIDNIAKETELANEMIRIMRENESTPERLARFGFPAEGQVTEEDMLRLRKGEFEDRIPDSLKELKWEKGALNMYYVMVRFVPQGMMERAGTALKELAGEQAVSVQMMLQLIGQAIPQEHQPMVYYFSVLASRTE